MLPLNLSIMEYTKEMQKVFPNGQINDAQMKVLKLFSLPIPSVEIKRLKQVLGRFLDDIVQQQLDKYIEEGKYPVGEELERMHLRTPYRSNGKNCA